MSDFLKECSDKYVAALQTERAQRNLAFLSDYEMIGDTLVYSLTPKLYLILVTMQSPLLVGGDLTPQSLLTFLWVIKVKKEEETKEHFFEQFVLNNNLDEILTEIVSYMETANRDVIVGSMGEDDTDKFYSSFAGMIMTFASECGWSEKAIMDIPYKRIHQYLRFLNLKNDPNTRVAMGNTSDKVLMEYALKK